MASPNLYVDWCRICRRWHEEYDSTCPKTYLKRLGHLIGRVWDKSLVVCDWLFSLYIRIAAVGLIALFAYLCAITLWF
jgi:hypothetical protein